MVHKANGGVLILSLRTMLAQPLLWLRLKQIVLGRKFKWFSPDDNKPLPVHIPDMPIDLKVILVSDREGLADFQDMEPDLCFNSIYGEFEADMSLVDTEDMQRWCSLVTTIANEYQLPPIAEDAWPILVHTAIRAIGDQGTLPLSPTLIARTLREAALHSNEVIDAQALNETLASRRWREGYLAERMHDEIELGQILIEPKVRSLVKSTACRY